VAGCPDDGAALRSSPEVPPHAQTATLTTIAQIQMPKSRFFMEFRSISSVEGVRVA
jgi:hypothetical protein